MRFSLAFAAALASVATALPAAAQVAGGEISLSHSAFTDDTSVNRTSLEGALEYSFGRNLSIQGDLGLHNFGLSNEDGNTLTLHGIYHMNDAASLGAYIGRDRVAGDSVTLYGIEAGGEIGQIGIEGYLGGFDDSGADGTLIGAQARYAYTDQVGFGAAFDYGRIDSSTDLTRFGINADYSMDSGPTFAAEIGQLDANAFGLGGTEAYAKLSVGFKFGAKRGATFGTRSLTRLLPGS